MRKVEQQDTCQLMGDGDSNATPPQIHKYTNTQIHKYTCVDFSLSNYGQTNVEIPVN